MNIKGSKQRAMFAGLACSLLLSPYVQAMNAESTVAMQKQNTNFSVDGNWHSRQKGKQVYLWQSNAENVNQHWVEKNVVGDFYSYKKKNTSLCLDGGQGAASRQAVTLEECDDNNINQHWAKLMTGNATYRLEKRNTRFSIDGNNGAKKEQGIYLWPSNSQNVNQQWQFSVLEGPSETPEPTVSFERPKQGDVLTEGEPLFVTVNAEDSDGEIKSVSLSVNDVFVRTERVVPYNWDTRELDAALQNLSPGTHRLTAVAEDNDGLTTTKTISFEIGEQPITTPNGDCTISGELKRWHRVALECQGPEVREGDAATFTDNRFNVTFSQNGEQIVIPGHFAADGDAADSSAQTGAVWRAYFTPPTLGTWNYVTSFRTGENVAVSINPNEGTPVSGIDGTNGTFDVTESNRVDQHTRDDPQDFRAKDKGLLVHSPGERYLRFKGDGSIFITAGMDSPENIFGYSQFDNTTKFQDAGSCKGILHDFSPHRDDWEEGDPTWGNGRGVELIGLVNYIASKGVNAAYIMMNTVRGDGCDAHPWSEYNASGNVKTFDVSKLDQWERVLGHMTRKGILIHAMTQETENDQLLNGGNLGLERKLYYRELISRFAHHPALQWNLGEENTNTTQQRKEYLEYISALDAYDHPIFMHTFPNGHDNYIGLLGDENFSGPTFQFGNIPDDASANGEGVYGTTVQWLQDSEQAGHTWVSTVTEASGGHAPTPFQPVTERQRIYWMWASVMSGGSGFEWYLKNDGQGHAYDLAVEDLREFDEHWDQSGHVAQFFEYAQEVGGIDLQQLERANNLTGTTSDWVLANEGSAYIVYLRSGGTTNIQLQGNSNYSVTWFNPRDGRFYAGDVIESGNPSIGTPPSEAGQDWAALIVATDDSATPPPAPPTGDFVEQDGVVVFEAQSTTSDLGEWLVDTSVSGYTGDSYLEFNGNSIVNGPPNSPLEYTFTVNEGGLYHLHMHVARETAPDGRTDLSNDAYVRLDGDYTAGPNPGNSHDDNATLSVLSSDTKFFGGNHNQFVWATGNRLDVGGHNNKRRAVYNLKAGETYTFVMHGRSKLFKVNRVVFRHESVSAAEATNLSLVETRR